MKRAIRPANTDVEWIRAVERVANALTIGGLAAGGENACHARAAC